MLQINGKTFMNLQEAVQWLLDNNALPFQSSANYVANTEIGMGTIVNPSPAKVRIGSLIFFADSKVSTVIGLTENGFMVSDQYNDLVDDVVYVSNVALNASAHLIVTLSNGDTIDAGLIKEASGFSINGSQHLIVTFNDGTQQDLGAIFSGNVNISGTLNATAITGDSIIETMTGYSVYVYQTDSNFNIEPVYAGICKNGNKLTMVYAVNITRLSTPDSKSLIDFNMPASIGEKIIPSFLGIDSYLETQKRDIYSSRTSSVEVRLGLYKLSDTNLRLWLESGANMVANTKYYLRFETTMLLSENLVS